MILWLAFLLKQLGFILVFVTLGISFSKFNWTVIPCIYIYMNDPMPKALALQGLGGFDAHNLSLVSTEVVSNRRIRDLWRTMIPCPGYKLHLLLLPRINSFVKLVAEFMEVLNG